MDLASRGLLIHDASSSPEGFPPPPIPSYQPPRVPDPSIPIIAVALIGILVTAFVLVSYYIFVIKCCLNWRQVDVISRFSVSWRNHRNDPILVYSPPRVQARGLDEAVIRSIPVRSFKSRGVGGGANGKTGEFDERSFCECAVCLNEFQEDEKLKIIPTCCHVFHVDCIDVWLQNNTNCPLCRTSISSAVLFPVNIALTPRPSPEEHVRSPDLMAGVGISRDKDFVVIELGGGNHGGPLSPESSFHSISFTRDSLFGSEHKTESLPRNCRRRMQFHKMTSMGDESIDTRRGGNDEFLIQPMRRSISMDSSVDRTLFLAVQEALRQQKRETHEVIDVEGCSSSSGNSNSKVWRSRSFFSFGHHGRVPRSAVRPIWSEL